MDNHKSRSTGSDERSGAKKILAYTEDGRYWLVPLLVGSDAPSDVKTQKRNYDNDPPLSERLTSSSSSSSRPTPQPAANISASTPAFRFSASMDKEKQKQPVTVINLDSSDEEEELELWNDEDGMLQIFVGTQAGRLHAFDLRGEGSGVEVLSVVWSDMAYQEVGQPVQELLVVDGHEKPNMTAVESSKSSLTGAMIVIGRRGKIRVVVLATQVLAHDPQSGSENAAASWTISQTWFRFITPRFTALSASAGRGWFGLSLSGDLLFYDQSVERFGMPLEIYQARQEISQKLQLMDAASHAIQALIQKGQAADREIMRLNRIIHTLQRAVEMNSQYGPGALIDVDISTIVFPPSLVSVVGKKYFLRLRISSALQLDWNDGWMLTWQLLPLRSICAVCQPPPQAAPPQMQTTDLSLGSCTTLRGLAPDRTIQSDFEVPLDQLNLPLQLQLGLEYRLIESSHRAVYFPVDLVFLDHLHFAEPVVSEDVSAPIPWPAPMEVLPDHRRELLQNEGSRQPCTCATLPSSTLGERSGIEYRWLERSGNQLYFLLDPPAMHSHIPTGAGHGKEDSPSPAPIIFDNCLAILLGEYVSPTDRLTSMLHSTEVAYLSIPASPPAVNKSSDSDRRLKNHLSSSRWRSTTIQIRLSLAGDDAESRRRAERWAVDAGHDRVQVCLTVSETANQASPSTVTATSYVLNVLERRICELMMS
ncbi:hypothetical protein BGW41_000523 [Actinomortierella wolfii]|nr:hypothetical protein BGW41_000523 [Actinomortierella wolfii]